MASTARALSAASSSASYEPLIVTPEVSKRDPSKIVAFIGRQLCFFEKNAPQPEIGQPVEVMITRALYRRKDNGYFDNSQIVALVIRPITDEDILIDHKGFECSGSMCRTTASAILDNQFILLTPGPTDIFVAENVSSRFYNNEMIPLRPGKAWIRRPGPDGMARLEGLARVDDAQYAPFVRR